MEHTDIKVIPVEIIVIDDLQARRTSASESLQREDLLAIKEFEVISKEVRKLTIQNGLNRKHADPFKYVPKINFPIDQFHRLRGYELNGAH
ncbi:MAG: hypothetical protein JRI73_11330 [Deltaproteobacteria bacterium]|nr:hypothetical protein [Deltaproteobacteria bacterium]